MFDERTYEQLNQLLDSQFDEVLRRSQAPIQYLPNANAPRAARVIELLRWAESSPEHVERLRRALTAFDVLAAEKAWLPSELPRPRILDDACHALANFGCCVLVGPRGIGKTTLARAVARRHQPNQFIVADQWEDSPLPYPLPELVVLDNVSEDHGVLHSGILGAVGGRLLVTTRSQKVAQRVLLERACTQHNERAVVVVGSLSVADATTFLSRRVGSALSDAEKQRLAKGLQGWPQALQAAAQLVIDGEVRCLQSAIGTLRAPDVVGEDGTWRIDGMIDRLTEHLVSARDERSRIVVRALCKTSFVGMQRSVIAAVVRLPPAGIDQSLSTLVATGFIRRDEDPRFAGDVVFVPHDTLRSCVAAKPNDADDRARDHRYLQYLAHLLRSGSAASVPLSARVDAWIVACRNSYPLPDDSRTSFCDRLKDYGGLIGTLFAEVAPSPPQIERVARLLGGRMGGALCNEAIPIAQILAKCAPNPVCARTVWLGATHDDGWARAISVWTAADHWIRLSTLAPDHSQAGRRLLWDWVQRSLPVGIQLEGGVGTDLDMACALGALVAFGDMREVVRVFRSPEFEGWRRVCGKQRRGGDLFLMVADAALVICALETGQPQWALQLLADAQHRIPPNIHGFLGQLVRGGAYSRSHSGFDEWDALDEAVLGNAIDAARSASLAQAMPASIMVQSMVIIRPRPAQRSRAAAGAAHQPTDFMASLTANELDEFRSWQPHAGWAQAVHAAVTKLPRHTFTILLLALGLLIALR